MSASFDDLWDQLHSKSLKQEGNFHLGITRPDLQEEMGQEEQETDKDSRSFDDMWEELHHTRSLVNKVSRIGSQFAIGAAENALLPYELATMSLGSKESQTAAYRENVGQEVEDLLAKKQSGVWDENDEKLLHGLQAQMQDTELSDPFVQTTNVGVRGLAEKATGLDLHPEGILEKSAGWLGFLKDPSKASSIIKDMAKSGSSIGVKDLIKTIIPGSKTIKSLSAGTALEMAEDGNFGPVGTIASAIAGDLIGGVPKGIANFAKNPKEKVANLMGIYRNIRSSNTKKAWSNQIAQDAKDLGIQLDAGTLTNSNIVKMAQARAAQSGLTGESADVFRKELSGQIVKQYQDLADTVGDLRFESNYQAAEAIRDALKTEERVLNIPKDIKERSKLARSLEGRIQQIEHEPIQQQFLHAISPIETPTDRIAGRALREQVRQIREPIQQEFNGRYTRMNEVLSEVPLGEQNELTRTVSEYLQRNEGSAFLSQGTAQHRVYNLVQRLNRNLNYLEDVQRIHADPRIIVNIQQPSVSDLIQIKREIADVAPWDLPTRDSRAQLMSLTNEIDQAVERTLRQNDQRLATQYRQLNSEYSEYKDVFENRNMYPINRRDNPSMAATYNKYVSDPDSLHSIEAVLQNTEEGNRLLNMMKRDFANRQITRTGFDARSVRNLGDILGPQFAPALDNYLVGLAHQAEHPLPRIAPQQGLSIRPTGHRFGPEVPVLGKAKEFTETASRKMYNFIKDKSADQIMSQMNTVEGIKKMKRSLSITDEGKKLFDELSRHKLEQMIGRKMTPDMTQEVKLKTFSELLKTTEDKAIVRELVGKEAYAKLRKIQSVSGHLADSAAKFFNASKSGTTLADTALVGAAVTGVITGNPWLAVPAIAKIGGFYTLSKLMFDKEFLKYLESAIENPKKFNISLQAMQPSVTRAIMSSKNNEE